MKYVFITGCQRSGTTLAGQILGAHPNAVLIDENHGVYPFLDALLNDAPDLEKRLANCLSKVRSNYVDKDRFASDGTLAEHITHVVLKTPNATYDYQRLGQIADGRFTFLHMVRDVRDVVSSMQRLAHVPMVENQAKLIERRPALASACSEDLAALKDATVPDHVRKALVWRIKTGLFSAFEKPPLNGLTVRYEDLATSPETWVPRIFTHAGLEPLSGSGPGHQDVMTGQGPGFTLRARSIDTTSISRWQRHLNASQEQDIWRVAEPLMTALGYTRHQGKKDLLNGFSGDFLAQPVVATGRGGSGTRLLSEMLKEHGVFLGNHLNVSNDSLEWADLVFEMYVRKLHEQLPGNEPLRSEVVARASHVLGRRGENPPRLWGWKLPESLMTLPEVLDALPDAKAIHLVRHPVTTCLRPAHTTAKPDHPIGQQTLLAAYKALGWTQDPRTDPDHVRNAASWVYQVGAVLEQCRAIGPARYLELRFEDIIGDPQRVSDGIAGFLDIDPVVTALSGSIDPARASTWTPGDERASEVWAICQPVALRLGYSEHDDGLRGRRAHNGIP